MCWYLGIFRFKDQSQLHCQVRGKRLGLRSEAELHSKQAAELWSCGAVELIAGWKAAIDWRYQAYFLGLFFREYRPKIWPKIWYSTSILGSWNDHRSVR
jgi:hypothetical protein